MTLIYRSRTILVPPELLARLIGPTPPHGYATNGMGPQKLGEGWAGRLLGRVVTWLVPDRILGWDLVIGAAWHDHAYDLGGSAADRIEADWNLAENIPVIVRWAEKHRRGGSAAHGLIAFGFAGLTFCALRLFGARAFNWAAGEQPRGLVAVVAERAGFAPED